MSDQLTEAINETEAYLDSEADWLAEHTEEELAVDDRRILASIRKLVTAAKTLIAIPKITVCTDRKSFHQAIFVNGELKDSESSLYANELSNWVGDGPVVIESVACNLPEGGCYPDQLSDLEIVIEA